MGDCFRIFFADATHKGSAFKTALKTKHVMLVRENILKVNDPSSNSDNYIVNEDGFLVIEVQVKTPFLFRLIRECFGKYPCQVKDCEDDEDAPGQELSAIFKTAPD